MKRRTAQGKMIDMESISLQNELAKAVGNIRVNARGDHIDSEGNIITKRADLMKKYYKVKETKKTTDINDEEDQ